MHTHHTHTPHTIHYFFVTSRCVCFIVVFYFIFIKVLIVFLSNLLDKEWSQTGGVKFPISQTHKQSRQTRVNRILLARRLSLYHPSANQEPELSIIPNKFHIKLTSSKLHRVTEGYKVILAQSANVRLLKFWLIPRQICTHAGKSEVIFLVLPLFMRAGFRRNWSESVFPCSFVSFHSWQKHKEKCPITLLPSTKGGTHLHHVIR